MGGRKLCEYRGGFCRLAKLASFIGSMAGPSKIWSTGRAYLLANVFGNDFVIASENFDRHAVVFELFQGFSGKFFWGVEEGQVAE